jgi:2-polyprenyl-6-methoxyphenol hydroxylase-like FAD-dependent oxidoreductase
MEVFDDFGIVDRLAAAGGPYPPQREYLADGSTRETTIMEAARPNPAEPYAGPLMVIQARTEAVMRERLAELGHRPQFGRRLIGFEQDSDGVTARVADADGEHRIRVRYLVGTDGGRSFVRHALGIPFPGKTLGVRALVADVRLDGLDRSAWHRFQLGTDSSMVMICPLAGTDLFQIQGPVPSDGGVDLSPAALTALIADRTGRDDMIVHSVSWASVYSMNARLADRYRVGRVFLAGDAAHIHPPTGGQGLNTSVQDAYNLGWKLAAVLDGAPAALLDTYEEERRPIAANMLGLSTRLLDEARKGAMKRNREVRQLDLGYRGSSLTLPGSIGTPRVQAGDRAPDAPGAGRANPRGCSTCSGGRTGRCWGMTSPNARHRARISVLSRLANGETSSMMIGTSPTPMAWQRASGRWSAPTAIWLQSWRLASWNERSRSCEGHKRRHERHGKIDDGH